MDVTPSADDSKFTFTLEEVEDLEELEKKRIKEEEEKLRLARLAAEADARAFVEGMPMLKMHEESDKAREEEDKPDKPAQPKPDEPKPEDAPAKPEQEPAKVEEKTPPLKDIEKLSQEELEKVFKRLPEEMQKEEEPTIPFAFKTEAESVPFPVINESVKRKIFPPPPKNEAEVAAKLKSRLERENAKLREREEELRRQEDAKALDAAKKAAKKAAEEAEKADAEQKKAAEKEAKKAAQMAKDLEEQQKKEAERLKKEEEKRIKDEAKRQKGLDELADKLAGDEQKAEAKRLREVEKARLAAEAQAQSDAEKAKVFRIVRSMPHGFQPLAIPKVRVSFSHKIADTAGGELQNWAPQWDPKTPKGKWIVEDEHTIRFDNDEPYPNSTRYTVKIPAGTPSTENNSLSEDYEFSFITSLNEATIHYPPLSSGANLVNALPIFFIEFEQHVDAKKLVDGGHIVVIKDGKKNPHGTLNIEKRSTLLDLATTMGLEKSIIAKIENAPEGKFVGCTISTPLERGERYSISVGPDFPSEEGPVLSNDTKKVFFTVRDSFKAEKLQVFGASRNAPTDTPKCFFQIDFSQPLVHPHAPTPLAPGEEERRQQPNLADQLAWKPKITPAVAGSWKVKPDAPCSLVYELNDDTKFANSTEYSIQVGPTDGAFSAHGEPLEFNESMTRQVVEKKRTGNDLILDTRFSTPTILLVRRFPAENSVVPLMPYFIITGDQRLDGAKVLPTLSIYSKKATVGAKIASFFSSAKPYCPLEVVSYDDAVKSSPWVAEHLAQYPLSDKNKAFIVRPTKPLEENCDVVLKIGPKVPSEEGQLLSEQEIEWNVQTPGHLKLERTACPPVGKDISLVFTQPLIHAWHRANAPDPMKKIKFVPMIVPPIKGIWRLGADNSELVFVKDPSVQWDNSTLYDISLGDDCVSQWGTPLTGNRGTRFETAKVRITNFFPKSGIHSPRCKMLIAFDQHIDAMEVAKVVQVKSDGSKKPFSLEVLKPADYKDDPALKDFLATAHAEEGKFLVVRTELPLPYEGNVSVKIGPQIPSAEGPLKSDDSAEYFFVVIPPFLVKDYVSHADGVQPGPRQRIVFFFNHPLVPPNKTKLSWTPTITPKPNGQGEWQLVSNGAVYDQYRMEYSPTEDWNRSTEYTIEIPADAQSEYGEVIYGPTKYPFFTPTVTVEGIDPVNKATIMRNPIFFIRFDQKVDPTKAIKHINLRRADKDKKKKGLALQLVPEKTAKAKNDQLKMSIEAASEQTWLCFAPTEPLPHSADLVLDIGPDIPSAEGPLTSDHEKSASYQVIEPLRATLSKQYPAADSNAIIDESEFSIVVTFNQAVALPLISTAASLKWQPTVEKLKANGKWKAMKNFDWELDKSSKILSTPKQKWANAQAYRVVLPPECASLMEESIEDPEKRRLLFNTPTPKLTFSYPNIKPSSSVRARPLGRGEHPVVPTSPVIILQFDQEIDKAAVANVVKFYQKKSGSFITKFLSKVEKPHCGARVIENSQHRIVKEFLEKNKDGKNWVVLEATKSFHHDAEGWVEVGPEIPSAEGPALGSETYETSFQVAPKLEASTYLDYQRGMIRITFNQNMFGTLGHNLLTLEQLGWSPVLEPQLPADLKPTWRVMTTTELQFTAKSLPRATAYKVSVPAFFAESVHGEKFSELYVYAPSAITNSCDIVIPSINTVSPHTIFAVTFNQYIDPKQTIKVITAVYGKKKDIVTVPMQLVPFKEAMMRLRGTKFLAEIIKKRNTHEGKMLLCETVDLIPPEIDFTINVGPNIPSIEGPEVTPGTQRYTRRTVAGFTVDTSLESNNKRISPSRPFQVVFNNAPAAQYRHAGFVTVRPPVRNLKFDKSRSNAYTWTFSYSSDVFNEETTYEIEVSPMLQDGYSQQLSEHIKDPAENKASRTIKWTVYPETFAYGISGATALDASSLTSATALPKSLIADPFLLVGAPTRESMDPRRHLRTPRVAVRSLNYKEARVVVYKVDPFRRHHQWPPVADFISLTGDEDPADPYPEFEKLYDATVPLKFVRDEETTTEIDLSPAVGKKSVIGQFGILIYPTRKAHFPNSVIARPKVLQWVQFTHLGVDVLGSPMRYHVWVTDLLTGKPIADARVYALTLSSFTDAKSEKNEKTIKDKSYKTNEHGVAEIDVSEKEKNELFVFIVKKGNDTVVFNTERIHVDHGEAIKNKCVWHVFDDRSIYRPKEDVYVKGYARLVTRQAIETTEVIKLPDVPQKIKYTVFDSRDIQIDEGETDLNAFGAFNFRATIPENANLGDCKITITMEVEEDKKKSSTKYETTHKFQLQEFRRPEFVSKTMIWQEHPYFYKDQAIVKTEASYYSGGGLSDSEITWTVSSKVGNFAPPGWSKFVFLVSEHKSWDSTFDHKEIKKLLTNMKGRSFLKIVFKGEPKNRSPVALAVDVEVLDINRQSLQSKTHLIVHPCKYYVGLNLPGGATMIPDQPFFVHFVVADIDGKLIPNETINVVVLARANSISDPPATFNIVVISKDEPVPYKVDPAMFNNAKVFTMSASITDPEGRKNESNVNFEAATQPPPPAPGPISNIIPSPVPLLHPSSIAPPTLFTLNHDDAMAKREAPRERVRAGLHDLKIPLEYNPIPISSLIISTTDKDLKVGQYAKLVVESPFAPAWLWITVFGANGVLYTRSAELLENKGDIALELVPQFSPNVRVRVEAVGSTDRLDENKTEVTTAPRRVATATGCLDLEVYPSHRELKVTVKPDEELLEPGGETNVIVEVLDWKGSLVDTAEICLVVVDESILALTEYEIKNPMKFFSSVEEAKRTIKDLQKCASRQRMLHKPLSSKEEPQIEELPDDVESEPELEEEPVFDISLAKDELVSDRRSFASTSLASGGLPNANSAIKPRKTSSRGDKGRQLDDNMLLAKRSESSIDDSDSGSEGDWDDSDEEAESEPQFMRESAFKEESMILQSIPKEESKSARKKSKITMKKEKDTKMKKADFSIERKRMAAPVKPSAAMAPSFSAGAPPPMASAAPFGGRGGGPAPPAPQRSSSLAGEIMADSFIMYNEAIMEPEVVFAPPEDGELFEDVDEELEEEEEEEEDIDIMMRADFNPLALFDASVPVDLRGRAVIPLKIPDSLTRYRIWAVAAGKDKFRDSFGIGEGLVTAQLPLVVRCVPPRFLNYGDQCELPIVIQNLREMNLDVLVGVRAINAYFDDEKTQRVGYRVEVPAEGRRVVNVPIQTKTSGEAVFQISVISRGYGDAQEIRILVFPPTASESFAESGSLKEKSLVTQQLSLPENALRDFGKVEVSFSSTQMQSMTQAIVSVRDYPHGCNEQISSKMLVMVSLQDVISQFKLGPSKTSMKEYVLDHMNILKDRQRKDGGFDMWGSSYKSELFISAHVAHAVAVCKAAGYNVGEGLLSGLFSKSWVSKLENYLAGELKDPTFTKHSGVYLQYSGAKRLDYAEFAYALYAYYKLSKSQKAIDIANTWASKVPMADLGIESVGMLLTVLSGAHGGTKSPLAEEVSRYIHNVVAVAEGDKVAKCPDPYGEEIRHLIFHDLARSDAVVLEGLVNHSTESPLIPPLVKGLMARRVNGEWANTQANAWAVVALDRYFRVFEKDVPDFKARMWLDKGFCGEEKFKGRTLDSTVTAIPIPFVLTTPESTDMKKLVIAKEGKGRLYYHITTQYATPSLQVSAKDKGFQVVRRYVAKPKPPNAPEDIKNQVDVTLAGGKYYIRKGALLEVHLELRVEFASHFVALVDQLPAGFEPIVSIKKASDPVPPSPAMGARATTNEVSILKWWIHENMRDSRVECYADNLSAGTYRYTFDVRATGVGSFIAPPVRAEEMYQPTVYGTSESLFVVIA